MEQPSARSVSFDHYLLDPVAGKLLAAERPVVLRPKTFEVLFYLAQRSGQLVTKEQLLGAIWPNVVVTDDSLVQCVSEIRRALNDDEQQIIRTMPRRGYIFTRPVVEVGSPSPATATRQAVAPALEKSPRTSESASPPVVRAEPAPSASISEREPPVLSGGRQALFGRAKRWIDRLRGRRRQVYVDTAFFRIVVLPLSRANDIDDGVAEELTANLTRNISRIPGGFVIARKIAERYKGVSIDAKQVGRELDVRYALQGHVKWVSHEIQLELDLVDTHTGQQVWAERFDGRPNDFVTQRIVRSLHLKLYEAEAERRRRERSTAPTFDDLVVQGFSLVERQTPETVEQARQLALEAIRLEPETVYGWNLLAFTYFVDLANRSFHLHGTRKEWTRLGQQAAAKAYALNPNDFYSIGVWAWALESRGRLEEAAAAVERQIAMNPSFTVALHRLAYVKNLMGQQEEAIALEQQVLHSSPIGNIFHNAYSTMAISLIHLGRDAEAIEAAQKAAEARPFYPNPYAYLAAAAGNVGDTQQARAALAELKRLLPNYTITSFRKEMLSSRPIYLEQREHFYDGLRKAGLAD